MGKNALSYEFGRVFERGGENPRPIRIVRTQSGLIIVNVVVIEQFQQKKSRVRQQAGRDPQMQKFLDAPYAQSKADGDYIDTFAEWHELDIMGDKAEALITDPQFGNGCVIDVIGATYEIDGMFTGRDGVLRHRRKETIGDKVGEVKIRYPRRDHETLEPLWNGIDELPKPGGSGGGQARQYSDDEGI